MKIQKIDYHEIGTSISKGLNDSIMTWYEKKVQHFNGMEWGDYMRIWLKDYFTLGRIQYKSSKLLLNCSCVLQRLPLPQ